MKETSTHIYFWGGIYSQWYKSNFESHDTMGKYFFSTAEQFMMHSKALLFGDTATAAAILNTNDPKKQKALGRQVEDFNDDVWNDNKFDIVVRGNFLKFSQNKSLKTQLLSTGSKVLVEGSPYDKIWGVGLHYSDELILDETKWKGENLLGKALMEVRNQLKDKK